MWIPTIVVKLRRLFLVTVVTVILPLLLSVMSLMNSMSAMIHVQQSSPTFVDYLQEPITDDSSSSASLVAAATTTTTTTVGGENHMIANQNNVEKNFIVKNEQGRRNEKENVSFTCCSTPLQKKARAIWLLSSSSNNSSNNDTLLLASPPHTLGALVHLGKTGGSSISTLLRYGCHSFRPKPCEDFLLRQSQYTPPWMESAVSKLTTYYHIPDFENGLLFRSTMLPQEQEEQYEFVIFTLRDPLDRLISSYLYTHPENEIIHLFQVYSKTLQYRQKLKELKSVQAVFEMRENKYRQRHKEKIALFACFPTLESFGAMLGLATAAVAVASIFDLVQNAQCVNSLKKEYFQQNSTVELKTVLPHFYWDLTRIQQQSLLAQGQLLVDKNNRTVMVLRTEHLTKDWINVNQYLGQQNKETIPLPVQHLRDSANIDYRVKRQLSEEGRRNICMGLETEYRHYLTLLRRAVNLDAKDVLESLKLSKMNCPWLNLSLLE